METLNYPIFTVLLVILGLFWTVASLLLPFFVWGIYAQQRQTTKWLNYIAAYLDGRNVRLENRDK